MTTYKLFYLKDYEYTYDNELKLIINNYHNNNIVIKVGDIENIKKEWKIIRNVKKYIKTGLPNYVCSPKKYNNKMILILPFYQFNSIYKAVWDIDNIKILKSLINQVFVNMFLYYHYYGLIYKIQNDEILFNKILINETNERIFRYSYQSIYETNKRTLQLDTNGYEAIMTDFENCYYVHKKDGILDYWNSIYNFIDSIYFDLMITIDNINIIKSFIKTQINIKGDYDNSIKLYYLLLLSEYKIINDDEEI